MPIDRLIDTGAFNPEAVQAIRAAFDGVLFELGLSDRTDPLVDLVAARTMALASEGEHDPVRLRDAVVKSFRD